MPRRKPLRGASSKEERECEYIKKSARKYGRYKGREEVAACRQAGANRTKAV